ASRTSCRSNHRRHWVFRRHRLTGLTGVHGRRSHGQQITDPPGSIATTTPPGAVPAAPEPSSTLPQKSGAGFIDDEAGPGSLSILSARALYRSKRSSIVIVLELPGPSPSRCPLEADLRAPSGRSRTL